MTDESVLISNVRDNWRGDYFDCMWAMIPGEHTPTYDVDEDDYDEWWENDN